MRTCNNNDNDNNNIIIINNNDINRDRKFYKNDFDLNLNMKPHIAYNIIIK